MRAQTRLSCVSKCGMRADLGSRMKPLHCLFACRSCCFRILLSGCMGGCQRGGLAVCGRPLEQSQSVVKPAVQHTQHLATLLTLSER